ncbi:MAG TPA: hypothetical protein VF883_00730 [Thermoanaerobaculia bacterium]|jgi:hypothetical protein
MTTKSNWQAVHDQMTEEDRRRLGDPPTGEEVLAYMNGELSEAEETRVRALLVAYPELARTLTHPFPSEEEGDAFSEDELSKHFAQFQQRVQPQTARVMPFRGLVAALAVAATLALVFGGLLVQARRDLAYVPPEAQDLLPGGRRGGSGSLERVAAAGQPLHLRISIGDQPEYPAYRLDVVNEEGKNFYSSEALERRNDETFSIVIPRGLPAGNYKIVLHSVDGPREQQLSEYAFRVPAR